MHTSCVTEVAKPYLNLTLEKHWKALYVATRAEKKVNAGLQAIGIESYLPLKTEMKQWSDRKKIVITPLINGYVFVQTNAANREVVFKIQNVIQYVRCDGKDAIIRDNEIAILKSIEQKGYHTEINTNTSFEEGEKTIITHGIFKGQKGIVKHKLSETLYHITIESIGYNLTITVPSEVLEKN